MQETLWALTALAVIFSSVYLICRTVADVERARVRREEWEVYAELQTRGLDPNPPGEDSE